MMVPIIIVFLLIPNGCEVYHIATPSGKINSSFSWNFMTAGILFVIASITDLLDGYLARKYQWVSNFGKLWDPIADKVLINSVLICFAVKGLTPVWITIIMIARDVIVDASRMYASTKNVVVPANFYGKLKTVAQMIAILVIFFVFNMNSSYTVYFWGVQNLMMYVALLFSVVSGIIYVYNIYRRPNNGVNP